MQAVATLRQLSNDRIAPPGRFPTRSVPLKRAVGSGGEPQDGSVAGQGNTARAETSAAEWARQTAAKESRVLARATRIVMGVLQQKVAGHGYRCALNEQVRDDNLPRAVADQISV